VTTFNRLEYLKEALASVEAQTYGNIELIVLDDGSTDGTAEFLSSYHPAFPFRFLRFEHQERSFLRNRGVEAARGPYVAFLDDDDVWDSEKVAAQAALLGSSPETGLIYVQTRVIDGSGLLDRGHTRLHRRLYRRQMRGRHSYAELADLCLMFTSAVMVRKDTFLEIGGYDRRWSSNEDLDLYLRMSRATTIRGIPRDLVSYRHHAATLTERLGETKIEVSRAHLEAIRERPELDPDGRVGNALAVSIARHHFYAGDYRAAARAIWALPRRLGSFWLRRENAVMGIRLAWWGAVRGLRGRREQNGPVR
jgi:glycosyltransferase involved in cell wall biosynthesis